MPRLPSNMIVRQDRQGYWFRGVLGGRTRQIALGTDYREACRRLRSLKTEGRPATTDETVRAVAERWLAEHCATNRTARGQQLAAQRMRDFVLPRLGHLRLHEVRKGDVRSLRRHLERSSGLSPATVVAVLSDARCLLSWCADEEMLDSSPFPRRKIMPKLQEQPPDRLTDEEADRIRALPEPYGFVCRLALGTGLRWGELCRAQAAHVKRFRAPGSGEESWFLEVSQTKSRKVRRVPLSPDLLREVRQEVGRLVPFAERSPGSFAKLVKRTTGIERFHVHMTRHTYACQWLERGGSLAALQQLLGHASIVTTQRYAKLTDEAVMREAARLQHPLGDTIVTQSSPSDLPAERRA